MNKKRMNENEWWQQACLVNKNDVKNSSRKKHSKAPQIWPCISFSFSFPDFILFLFFPIEKEGTFGVSRKQNNEVFYFYSVAVLVDKKKVAV